MSSLTQSKLNFITPLCQHKTGSAVESVVFCTYPLLLPCCQGLKPHITQGNSIWSDNLHAFASLFISLSLLLFFWIDRMSFPLSHLISGLPLPISTSVCPLLIISLFLFPSSLSLPPSFCPWLSGVAVRALWWLPPAIGSESTIWLLSACPSVSLCVHWSVAFRRWRCDGDKRPWLGKV